MPPRSTPEKFWKRVNKTEYCWIWMGAHQKDGYGILTYHQKGYLAHRLSYELCNGLIPDGLYVCHTCDNPSCVNPSHLYLGTQSDNMKDRARRGRNNQTRANHPRAKFSEKEIEIIRTNYTGMRGEQRRLARKYNVAESTIRSIVKFINWK